MSDREDELDLLADHVVVIMPGLCVEAIRESISEASVLRLCKIDQRDACTLKYADGLLDDILDHIANRWSQFRETQKRLCSFGPATYDSSEDFD
jgi:hypothetical protein